MSKKLTAEKLLNKEFNLVNEEEWGVFQEWEANHDVKVNGVKCDYAIVDSANFVFFSEEGEITL